MKLKCLLIIAVMVLSGCAPKEQPIKTPLYDQYPEDKYMTALGIGDTEDEARSQALAELSYTFVSKIKSETLDRVKLVVDKSGHETTEQTLKKKVRVSSDVELKGVEIVDVWSAKGQFCAFAVLEKSKAIDVWLMELQDMDYQVEGSISAAWAPESNLVKYKLLKKAIDLWVKREAVASRLLVIGYEAEEEVEAPYEMLPVFRQINKIKSQTALYILIKGDYSGIIRENISEKLARAGYVFATNPKTADVIIQGTVTVERLNIDAPDLTYASASLSLSIKDIAADVSLGEISEQMRGAHLYFNDAVKSAMMKVVSSATKKLIQILEGS
jgi:hypothetical protein